MMPTPTWWKYVVLEDEDGVGIIKGFKKNTPKEVIKEYKEYVKHMRELEEDELTCYE